MKERRFSPSAPDSPMKPLPSWKESMLGLDSVQRITAEIAFSASLLIRFQQDAGKELPTLTLDAYRSGRFSGKPKEKKRRDRHLQAEHVIDLFSAFKAISSQNEETLQTFRESPRYSNFLENRVRKEVASIEQERDRVYAEAKGWTFTDQRKAIRNLRNALSSVPKHERELLYQQTDITPEKVREKMVRWGITAGGTVGSTLAIEGIATACGLTLSNSSALDTWGTKSLMLFLAESYGMWFKGMRENTNANWELLEQEGVSTNAPSKALYDMAGRRGWSERKQKIVAGAGYVGTEIAKELPYYTGAFGAATVWNEISNDDAIIFLAGANIGAGLYEYGFSKITKVGLHIRARVKNKSGQITKIDR